MEKRLHIYRAIPSLFTVAAFMFGFNAILLAINGQIKEAITFILISAFLDLFDGRIARILGTTSKFGAELDSLSDLVCFGVATAIIVLSYTGSAHRLLYLSAMFFAICSMLRLARFNLDIEPPAYAKGFFMGVPTPAGFMLGVLPITIHFAWGFEISSLHYGIYMLIVGFLMISNIPTPSTKSFHIKRNQLPLIIGITALLLICVFLYSWAVMSVFGIVYLISILFCIAITKRNKRIYKENNKN
ncbi:MAG: CDP-diacylglycerol--serine O-phosphatidyltransferase [Alphaproteobacteria bacterium]|jgi:CDP-diacylglycerol--serine O-phosphatidyltransferase|nr:CDP-diacylglycerol--serine O-phosphatidyltransferase [Alphaproteobacteria bacterium]